MVDDNSKFKENIQKILTVFLSLQQLKDSCEKVGYLERYSESIKSFDIKYRNNFVHDNYKIENDITELWISFLEELTNSMVNTINSNKDKQGSNFLIFKNEIINTQKKLRGNELEVYPDIFNNIYQIGEKIEADINLENSLKKKNIYFNSFFAFFGAFIGFVLSYFLGYIFSFNILCGIISVIIIIVLSIYLWKKKISML